MRDKRLSFLVLLLLSAGVCRDLRGQGYPYTHAHLLSLNDSTQYPCGDHGTPTQQIAAAIAAIPLGGTVDLTCYQQPITISSDIFSSVTKPLTIILPPTTVTVNANTTIPATMTLVYNPGSVLASGPGYVITNSANALMAPNGVQVQLQSVTAPTLTPSTGGSLSLTTYYYVITGLTSGGGETQASTEASITLTGTNKTVGLAWPAISSASTYRVYRGTSASGENVYYTSATNSYTDTGAAGTAASPPSTNTAWVALTAGSGSGLQDPGSNGIVKRTALDTTTVAAYSDVVGLWTSCTLGYLKYDGTCSNPTGTGTVTSVGLAGTANQITVTGASPITGSGSWTLSFPSTLFQTNSVSNTSVNGVNFLTSTSNSVGLTVTPVNSATNGMKFEVSGSSYTGNAATATALAATPSQCTGGQFATGVAASGNANCGSPAGGGTVTSVGLSGTANQITVTGASPITGSGSWTLSFPSTLFQTNSVSNTSVNGVNFLTSTSNSVGLTVTPVNSATNGMKFEVSGSSYSGNAATATALASITGYSVYGSGASAGTWITPTANGQCFMSGAASYATTTPSFQTCPSGFTNPMTTLGDIIYENATPAAARLAGATGPNSVPQFLSSTPSGGVAQAPAWSLAGIATNAQTGTSYTVLATDRNSYVSFSNGSSIAVALPQANSTGFTSNFAFKACDIGTGTATITPATSTISYTTGSSYTSGASSMALTTGQCATVYSDNTNYFANIIETGSGMTYPGAGIAVSTGSAWGSSLTAPTGSLVGNGQANTYSTGLQDLSSATVKLPASAAYAPTTAALFGYDTTNNRAVLGNGTNTSYLTWMTSAPTDTHFAVFSGTLGKLSDGGAVGALAAAGYPGAGLPLSTGSAWGTSISETDGDIIAGVSGAWNKTATLPTAAFPALSGDVSNTAGSLATTLRTALNTRTQVFDLQAPVSGDDGIYAVFDPATAIHLTRFACGVTGTTSVVTNLVKSANSLLSDQTCTAGTVEQVSTTTWANGSSQCGGTSNCAVAAHTPVIVHIGTISGTPTNLAIAIDYTVD